MRKIFLGVNLFLISLVLILTGFFVFSPVPAVAQGLADVDNQDAAFATEAGYDRDTIGRPQDPRLIVSQIIRMALSIMGVLIIAYVVWGGYMIVTSGGKEERIEKGKKSIYTSIIGAVLIFCALSITWFVFNFVLKNATTADDDSVLKFNFWVSPVSPPPMGAEGPAADPSLTAPSGCTWFGCE
jgi:hypothetical protein